MRQAARRGKTPCTNGSPRTVCAWLISAVEVVSTPRLGSISARPKSSGSGGISAARARRPRDRAGSNPGGRLASRLRRTHPRLVQLWETRQVYASREAFFNDIRSRKGRSILHELSDVELEDLISYMDERLNGDCRLSIATDGRSGWVTNLLEREGRGGRRRRDRGGGARSRRQIGAPRPLIRPAAPAPDSPLPLAAFL